MSSIPRTTLPAGYRPGRPNPLAQHVSPGVYTVNGKRVLSQNRPVIPRKKVVANTGGTTQTTQPVGTPEVVQPPVATQPTTPPAIPTTPAPNPNPGPGDPSKSLPITQGQDNGTFKGVRDFIPTNVENDPLYQWQKQEGQNEIKKQMASMGLTDSGAQIESNTRLLGDLGAKKYERDMNLAQTDAGRYDNYAQNEADRLINRSDAQWQRLMDIMNFQGKQNPMDAAMGGLDKLGSLQMDRGKTMADYLKDVYARIMGRGGGGGGGGGGARPPFVPPVPGQADHSMSDIYQALNSGNTNENIFSSILRGLSNINW